MAPTWCWAPARSGFTRVVRRSPAGLVLVIAPWNRCDYIDPALAWSGVKDSGHGASLGRYGFDAVTRPHSYHFREL